MAASRHTYRVEVAVRGRSLRADGTLFDLVRLQDVVRASASQLHYHDLDQLPELAGRNTSAEVVAEHLFEQLAPQLTGQGLTSLSVRLWESPQGYAVCEGEID